MESKGEVNHGERRQAQSEVERSSEGSDTSDSDTSSSSESSTTKEKNFDVPHLNKAGGNLMANERSISGCKCTRKEDDNERYCNKCVMCHNYLTLYGEGTKCDVWPYKRPRMRLWVPPDLLSDFDDDSSSGSSCYDDAESGVGIATSDDIRSLIAPPSKRPRRNRQRSSPNMKTQKCGMLIRRDFRSDHLSTVMFHLWRVNFKMYVRRKDFQKEFLVTAKYKNDGIIDFPHEFWLIEVSERLFKLIKDKGFKLRRQGCESVLIFDYITQIKWLRGNWHKVDN